MLTITVSQLNRYIKAVLDEDHKLRDVYGIDNVGFALADIEAAEAVGLNRVQNLNVITALKKEGIDRQPILPGSFHRDGNVGGCDSVIRKNGENLFATVCGIRKRERLAQLVAALVDNRRFVSSFRNVDADVKHRGVRLL